MPTVADLSGTDRLFLGRALFHQKLLQLRVFRLCLDENGNIGVDIFLELKKVFVRRLSFGSLASHCIGATDLEMSQRACYKVQYDASMVSIDFAPRFPALTLSVNTCFLALMDNLIFTGG
jgi:hypothetical protein